MSHSAKTSRGFTLVEILVVAPIIILSIGAFIALVVTLTGNTLASRGSSMMQYQIQDALDDIENDIRRSAGILAVNDIPLSASNRLGYVTDPYASSSGSVTNFTNIDRSQSGGSTAALVLKQFATSRNPAMAADSSIKYLADTPNPCTGDFKKNTPVYVNTIYFVSGNILWKRTLTYPDLGSANYCQNGMWHRSSCSPGASATGCVIKDTKLVENINPADFSVRYFNAANSAAPNTQAVNQSASDAYRNSQLENITTAEVTIKSTRTIAGREVSKQGTIRATRLNSTSDTPKPTIGGTLQSSVYDGRKVLFMWQAAQGASIYDVEYRINGGAWQYGATLNNDYMYSVTANHTDTVEARVLARNISGASPYVTGSRSIPLWAPLALQGGWEDYGSGYTTAAYTRTRAGLVMIKGLVKNATAPAKPSIIGALPADYAPTGRFLLGTMTYPNASSRIDIDAGGNIYFTDDGHNTWISLDSIQYIAANANATRTALSYSNGFSNYGGAYAPGSYVQDSSGRVSIQGLLAGGTRTMNSVISVLPSSIRAEKYQHHSSRSGTWHHLALESGNGLQARGDGTGAYSINVSYLPASYTGWQDIPLANSWVYYDGGSGMYATPQYTKTNDNVVHLKGLIRSGTISGSLPIATLPPGFRPSQRILTVAASSSGAARLDIRSDGQVFASTGSNTWYSLSGIMFIAEQ